MKRLFIVTAPIEYGRRELEEALWKVEVCPTQAKVTEVMYENLDFQLWDIEDFTEYCNDQRFDVESCWMTHICVEVPDNYTPNNSPWYFDLIRF